MDDAKHTPGTWSYDPRNRLVCGAGADAHDLPTICDVLDTSEGLEGDCPQADANGSLIASAPELLAALEAVLTLEPYLNADTFDGYAAGVMRQARAAVQAAKGGAA